MPTKNKRTVWGEQLGALEPGLSYNPNQTTPSTNTSMRVELENKKDAKKNTENVDIVC